MSLLKSLIDSVLSREPGAAALPGQQSLLNSVLGMIGSGGLNSLLDGFRQQGRGDAVQSWVGTGANLPVSAEEVQASLGEGQIAEIAQHAGLSKDQTAGGLAALLPQVVDRLTPDGKLPDGASLAGLLQSFIARSGDRKS
jgi:uncharacterized protein YidB (DUF937 family)